MMVGMALQTEGTPWPSFSPSRMWEKTWNRVMAACRAGQGRAGQGRAGRRVQSKGAGVEWSRTATGRRVKGAAAQLRLTKILPRRRGGNLSAP